MVVIGRGLQPLVTALVLASATLGALARPSALPAQAVAAAPAGGAWARDSLRAAIEQAVVVADWPSVERAAARLRSVVGTGGARDPWAHYDLAYALHRRASAMLVQEQVAQAKPLLEEAVRAATRARELGGGGAAQALEGALTGQLAGATGGLGMVRLGRRSFTLLDEAVAAAPNDPRVAFLNGLTRLNAPAFAGGGASRAESELRRALRLFATDRPAAGQPTWGRVDAHIWLAIALEKQDKLSEARAELARALELAPGHRWIVETLQPALARRSR